MQEQRAAIVFGVAAYGLWGLFPLYFLLFAASPASEVVAHRAWWSLVVCAVGLTAARQWNQVAAALRDRRGACLLALAGGLIVGNWTGYVYGVSIGRTLETAMGYFINPLAVAGLGIVVLRERLRPLQWAAMVFGLLAVLVMALLYGQVPWIALLLAGTFGTYSLVKKLAGRSIGALPGLTIETGAIAGLAVCYLGYLAYTGQSTWLASPHYPWLLMSTGIVTVVPLLLFAACARRVSMVLLAMLQYLAPIGQFLIGWLVLHEPMPPARWAGFVLVWVAVVFFLIDAVLVGRRFAVRRR